MRGKSCVIRFNSIQSIQSYPSLLSSAITPPPLTRTYRSNLIASQVPIQHLYSTSALVSSRLYDLSGFSCFASFSFTISTCFLLCSSFLSPFRLVLTSLSIFLYTLFIHHVSCSLRLACVVFSFVLPSFLPPTPPLYTFLST